MSESFQKALKNRFGFTGGEHRSVRYQALRVSPSRSVPLRGGSTLGLGVSKCFVKWAFWFSTRALSAMSLHKPEDEAELPSEGLISAVTSDEHGEPAREARRCPQGRVERGAVT